MPASVPSHERVSAPGIAFAIASYLLWGVLPLLFLALPPTGAPEIVAWRIVLSLARCRDNRFYLLGRVESLQVSIERLQSLGLTEREAEVMHWVCEGKNNPEIAQILDVTLHTVNRHNEHIFKKLAVDNRHKAIKTVKERLGV